VADPKWDFVVLNVGEDEGAEDSMVNCSSAAKGAGGQGHHQEVQKGRCIANLIPGWKLADVTEGDQVIPAIPSREAFSEQQAPRLFLSSDC
jgi:hypothetical protein